MSVCQHFTVQQVRPHGGSDANCEKITIPNQSQRVTSSPERGTFSKWSLLHIFAALQTEFSHFQIKFGILSAYWSGSHGNALLFRS